MVYVQVIKYKEHVKLRPSSSHASLSLEDLGTQTVTPRQSLENSMWSYQPKSKHLYILISWFLTEGLSLVILKQSSWSTKSTYMPQYSSQILVS